MKKIIYIFVLSLLSNCAQQKNYNDFISFSNYELNHLSCDNIAMEIENLIYFQKTNQIERLEKLKIDPQKYRTSTHYRKKIKSITQKKLHSLNELAYRKNCL